MSGKILKLNTAGNIVDKYNNLTELVDKNHCAKSSVSRAINNPEKGHKVGGFYYCRTEDLEITQGKISDSNFSIYNQKGVLVKTYTCIDTISEFFGLTQQRMNYYISEGVAVTASDNNLYVCAQGNKKEIKLNEDGVIIDKFEVLDITNGKHVQSYYSESDVAKVLSVTRALVNRCVMHGSMINKRHKIYRSPTKIFYRAIDS